MQALMIVKQYQLSLSIRIVNLWRWDLKVIKNLVFIIMNSMHQQREEKSNTLIILHLILG